MTLSKTQLAVVCALLAVAPLAWQRHALAGVRRDEASLRSAWNEQQAMAARADAEVRRLRDGAVRAGAERAAAESRLAAMGNATGPAALPAKYRWDDASPLARVPKSMLKAAPLDGVTNRQGALSIPTATVLQFTDAEKAAVQGALDRFMAGYRTALKESTVRVEPSARELGLIGHDAANVRTFAVTGLKERVAELRRTLFDEFRAVLDAERFAAFTRSLGDWMAIDDEPRGLNSARAIYNEDLRFFYVNESFLADDELHFGYGLSTAEGSYLRVTMGLGDIPEFVRPQLQDWIDRALADQAAKKSGPRPDVPGKP